MNRREIKNLLEILTELGEIVNPVIRDVLNVGLPRELKELVNYQIIVGGKRLRPAFLLISCYLFNGKTKDAIFPAAGIEILHNGSLIIDDMIDNSFLRRNKKTLWKKHGTSIAQCVSMIYTSAVFKAAMRSKNPILISEIFSQLMKDLADGEIMDILFERVGKTEEPYVVKNRYKKITKENSRRMISKKTASLFRSCCEIGAICGGASKKEIAFLIEYGHNTGMAFQIQDDILDIFGNEEKFGKEIGKDIKERKGGNIVITSALQELSNKESRKINDILKKRRITKKDVYEIIALLKKTNALEKSTRAAKRCIRKAKKALEKLPQNRWNKTLEMLADFTIERNK